MKPEIYVWIADIILVLHLLFVAFVVGSQVLIVAGGVLKWRWVRHVRFRIVHVLCIGIVVVQSWLGVICPLTLLENALREKSGDAGYTGSFIAHWLNELLYIEAPWWVFTVAYSLFGVSVIAAWIWVKPCPA
jgi:hypothetical protein